MPPVMCLSFWSAMVVMIRMFGCLGSSSKVVASSMPALRAAAMTAICRPRHRPRYGILLLQGVLGGLDLAFQAALAEATGHDDAVIAFAVRRQMSVPGASNLQASIQVISIAHVIVPGGRFERFEDRHVGVGVVHVFGDEADFDGLVVVGGGPS